MTKYELNVRWNIAESGIYPMSSRELLDLLPPEERQSELDRLLDLRLGYSEACGTLSLPNRGRRLSVRNLSRHIAERLGIDESSARRRSGVDSASCDRLRFVRTGYAQASRARAESPMSGCMEAPGVYSKLDWM
jgi:hypothetical protein